MCDIIQISQAHPPIGTRGPFSLVILQSLPPTAPACSLCSWVQPTCGLVWCAVSSSPGLWVPLVNCSWSELSSVGRCYPFNHLQESFLHQWGEGEMIKQNTMKFFHFWSSCDLENVVCYILKNSSAVTSFVLGREAHFCETCRLIFQRNWIQGSI